VRFEDVQWHGAVFQDDIVEFALVEFRAELFFGERAEFADFELADFVGKGLTGPGDVTVDFDGDVLIGFSGVVLEKLNGLLTAPAHGVHSGVHDETHGAPHFVRELAEFRVGVFVQTEICAEAFGIEAPAFDESGVADMAAKFGDVVEFLAKRDLQVMAGNGTIGLEILEDLPTVDVVLVPFGGGGLSVGIASAVKALRSETGVYTVEPETGAPFAASFVAGQPQRVEYEPSFVDGSGSPALLPKMWELARGVLDGAATMPIADTAAAVRLLAERVRVVAEGAGALSVAAAMAGKGGSGNVVCVVSGGNIDSSKLETILAGGTP